ncbi:MAG: MlaD family protein [Chitinivibrionales bacterium]
MNEHQKRLVWARFKVGIVVTTTLVILFITVFFSGAFFGLFSPNAELTVNMNEVAGLRNGAPVWLLGVEIGTVSDIELTQEGTVVTLSVKKSKLKFIHRDAKASIMTMGLLGDKFVSIDPGSPQGEPIEPNAQIQGEISPGLGEIIEYGAESVNKVESFIIRLDTLVASIQKGQGNLARLLQDSTLYENLAATMKNFRTLTQWMMNEDGTFQKLIEDPSLYRSVTQAGQSLAQFGNRLNDSSGTLYQLTHDAQLYNNLNQSAQQLSSILQEIQQGQGTAGTLVKDEQLAHELRTTVKVLNALVEDIQKNPKKYFSFELF